MSSSVKAALGGHYMCLRFINTKWDLRMCANRFSTTSRKQNILTMKDSQRIHKSSLSVALFVFYSWESCLITGLLPLLTSLNSHIFYRSYLYRLSAILLEVFLHYEADWRLMQESHFSYFTTPLSHLTISLLCHPKFNIRSLRRLHRVELTAACFR